jgi:integrase
MRRIKLDRPVVELVYAHVAEHGIGPSDVTDEPYLDEKTRNRIWTAAVKDSGIPFKPTAYQVRHTHASWLIDVGENNTGQPPEQLQSPTAQHNSPPGGDWSEPS